MQFQFWLLAVLLALVGTALGYLVGIIRERSRAARNASASALQIDAFRNEAARVPDLLLRSERAELEKAQLGQELQAALGQAAALTATLAASANEAQQLALAKEALEGRRAALEEQHNEQLKTTASASASLVSAQEQARQYAAERDRNASELAQLREQFAELGARFAKACADRDAAVVAAAQTKAFLDEAQTKMRSVFLDAASKVFDEKTIALDQRIKASGEASREGLEATLKPLSEKVGQFQSRIEEFASTQSRDLAKFEGSIGTLQKLNQEMADATNSLARALKGNSKARGDWGEMILETVLKASGLVEGTNYSSQSSSVDEESGKRRTPDVIVNLPDGRKVVVDSKVNLVAWTEAINAETPEDYEDAIIRHTAAMRLHVRDLAEKNYPRVVGLDSLDLTVMFVPIEGALSAALSFNGDLQMEALTKKIVFASPNTLMAMLRVVERLWIRDRLQRQVDTIGNEAGKVMDALIDFLDDFKGIETSIRKVQDAFDKAENRLTESDRSVVKRAQRLVEAGAKGKKAIPDQLLPVGEAATPLLGSEEVLDATPPLGDTPAT